MKKINFYSDILSTKGFNRSLLFDTTRSEYYFISNEMLEICEINKFKLIDTNLIQREFYKTFLENDLIYESDDQTNNCFIPINKDWDFSFKITNCIIELSDENIDNLMKLLNFNFVAHFHILINEEIENSTLDKLFYFLENQICDCIEFSFTKNLEINSLTYFKNKLTDLNKIVKILNYANLDFTKEFETAFRYEIVLDRLSLKLSKSSDHFFESLNYHTYFNRKLFISKKGEIKNAFESNEIFGNINQINLIEEILSIIDKPQFQKYWNINKNSIDVCKDCELKNICIDNRLPIQRKHNEWFHLNECIYNPYISKWSDDEGYKTLKECGVIINKIGFSIDYEKLSEINYLLWHNEESEGIIE
jgi:hypothetical protein